jgi:hypothetical protein
MDSDLKSYLESMETRMSEHTEAAVRSMEARLRENTEAVETRLRDHIEVVEARLREHTEVVETRLLGEFWKWAKTTDARYRQHWGTVTALDERVALVEDRITALESRARAN